MPDLVRCSGCGDALPVGQRCPTCPTPRASIPGYAGYRRTRRDVLVPGAVCWICKKPGTPDDPLTVDHVVPRARGGTHARRNLRPAHKSCNEAKGAGAPRPPGIHVVA